MADSGWDCSAANTGPLDIVLYDVRNATVYGVLHTALGGQDCAAHSGAGCAVELSEHSGCCASICASSPCPEAAQQLPLSCSCAPITCGAQKQLLPVLDGLDDLGITVRFTNAGHCPPRADL